MCVAALTALPLAAANGVSATPLAARAPSPSAETREVLRERTFPLDAERFRSLCDPAPVGTPREHTFEFFEDFRITALEEGVEESNGTLTWNGHVRGRPDTSVVVSIRGVCKTDKKEKEGQEDHEGKEDKEGKGGKEDRTDGADETDHKSKGKVVVEVHADLVDRVYRLQTLPGHPPQLRATEENPYVRPPRTPDQPAIDPASASAMRRSLQGGTEATADRPVVIDVIAGYTRQAITTAGGEQQVINRIYWAERKMNEALADSNIPASIDILGTYNTDYAGDNTSSVMHAKLINPQDADLGATADKLRRRHGADLLTVVNNVGAGSTGQANLPTRGIFNSKDAFSVVDFGSLISFYNLGHELGHNLGLFHDRATLTVQYNNTNNWLNDLNAPYGTGWITPNGRHHTLMAYASACPQPCSTVNQYSNTENTFNGQPLGDANNNNAALARLSTPIVAGYRTLTKHKARHALIVSSTDGGTIRPSFFGPYKPGTIVGVTARPQAGFRLAAWLYDGVQYDASPQFNVTMDDAHRLHGIFLPVTP